MRRPTFGSIYQRRKKHPDGSVTILPNWWIKYRKNGQVFRESSGSEKYADAERLLKRRQGEIVTGKFAGLGPERIRMEELFGDVVQDYRDNRRDTLKDVESRLKNHLSPFFGKIRAADFSTQHLKRYIAVRRDDGAENATINRELAIVRRAFNLGAKADPPRVGRAPKIQLLKETNIREGFIEHAQYVTLRNELPPYLRPLFVVAYHIGGRRGELTMIRWPQIDFAANQIRLNREDTKNEQGRTLPIYGEMREWLLMARDIRDQKLPDCPWVFYDDRGERLYWFYKAWKDACVRAGLGELLFHDLRRSAVRNMERAGVSRKVAMSISGHKTEQIYRRYDIVGERDLRDAAARMDRYLGGAQSQTGTLLGTPGTESVRQGESDCSSNQPKLPN